MAGLPSSSIATALGGAASAVDPYTQLLTVLLPILSGILPGATQNQETQQQQASQRQLSASDLATNPTTFLQQIASLLGGTSGGSDASAGGITGAIQAAIQKFTTGNSQNLSNSVWQQEQPQLAASGLSQAPGIANEELATALAPSQLSEQQLGAQEGVGAVSGALSTEESNLQFPFSIGSSGAGSFPSFATL